MSVRCVRALARWAAIGAIALSSCSAMADDSFFGHAALEPAAFEVIPQEFAFAPPVSPFVVNTAEPFGGVSGPVRGALAEKWNIAKTELQIDIDIITACRAKPEDCESAAAMRIAGIVAQAKIREGRALIGEINRAVNLTIAAMSDITQFGIDDRWASPLMTFTSGRGDCEDYALAKYAALRIAGFGRDDLRLLIVRLPKAQTVHAVLSVRIEGRWLILDNRRFAMLETVNLDAVLLFTMRDDEERPAAIAAQGQKVGGPFAFSAGDSSSGNVPNLM